MDPGTKLGPYKILEPLGAGGMGEVYLAEDSRLGRTVAIKILPPDFATDRERVARFEQEARAAAALNHPNIATVFDVGEYDAGVRYIVQEHLVGESLRDFQREGAPSLERSLAIASEVAEALAVASRAGIVHRDIKPENIFVTESGAKVLDFGIAKLVHPGALGGGSEDSAPTAIGTVAGAVIGTVGYMAPEQVEAGPVDNRTDLFALGCVLYELVTGQRPFHGDNAHTILGQIVSSEPAPIHELNPHLPLKLQWIIAKCLAKAPERRYQHAEDLAVDLRGLRAELEGTVSSPGAPVGIAAPQSRGRLRPLTLVLAALVGAAVTAAAMWGMRAPEPAEVTRLSMELEEGHWLGPIAQFARPVWRSFAVSPDGRRLAYASPEDGPPRLLRVRDLDQPFATAIPDTRGASQPFFSPDGEWIGFEVSGDLYRVPAAGGAAEQIATVEGLAAFPSWADDGFIYFANFDGIQRVPASGGTAETVTTVDPEAGERWLAQPQALPGGAALLMTVMRDEALGVPSRGEIVAVDLDTGQRTPVISGGSDPRYLPSGHLVFARSGTLMAVGFDVAALATVGAPELVLDDLMQAERTGNGFTDTGIGQFAVSASGALFYARGGIVPEVRHVLEFREADGTRERLEMDPSNLVGARLSPGGEYVAYSADTDDARLWVYSIANRTARPLTSAGVSSWLVWSADGTRIAFWWTQPGGDTGVFWVRADGSGEPQRIAGADGPPVAWASDGRLVYLAGLIMVLDDIDDLEPEPLFESENGFRSPALSPDEKWIAYASVETGTGEIWVRGFPEGEPSYRVTTAGGSNPAWSKSGDRLYFRRVEGNRDRVAIWEVDVDPGAGFARRGEPRFLVENEHDTVPIRSYDVAADGRLLLRVDAEESARPQPVTKLEVVLNWFKELERRVPTGK